MNILQRLAGQRLNITPQEIQRGSIYTDLDGNYVVAQTTPIGETRPYAESKYSGTRTFNALPGPIQAGHRGDLNINGQDVLTTMRSGIGRMGDLTPGIGFHEAMGRPQTIRDRAEKIVWDRNAAGSWDLRFAETPSEADIQIELARLISQGL